MENYICKTCGVKYSDSDLPPENCHICLDERQYLNPDGQQWITMNELQNTHNNVFENEEPELISIRTEPRFAIGQRALLVRTPQGNILWDCISLIDDETVERIEKLGGIKAMAISHPHFYSSMVEWSKGFGNIPIYLPSADKQWVMRQDSNIIFWEGDQYSLLDGLTIIRCGGHFEGSSVLHWRGGADGKGVLLSGDTIHVVSDRRYVSFMYSYPNLIPLSPVKVGKIVHVVEPFEFDRIYGGWTEAKVKHNARESFLKSSKRYINAITIQSKHLLTD